MMATCQSIEKPMHPHVDVDTDSGAYYVEQPANAASAFRQGITMAERRREISQQGRGRSSSQRDSSE